jgi:DNA-binding NarL/FixJ family response regulator
MRVILVGPDRARARVRAETNGSLTIVAEAPTLAAARAAVTDADAWLVAVDDVRNDDANDPAIVEPLTEREVDVLELLAEGLSNKGIAARLGISDQTIKFHVSSIAGKLGTHNRTETVRLALRRGLITL